MKKNIIIRQVTEADYSIIYTLIKTAFETAAHSDGDEQDFAVGLRNSGNYIPGLDLAAELDGRLIGHIMFTRTYVTLPNGGKYDTLLVAPLSVLSEYRSSGIGSALMKEGLRIAATMGYKTAFLIGDPEYYKRFGYRLASHFGIRHNEFPAEYVQVKEIVPNALDGITGIITM